jgi:hypothetical protein
VKLLIEPLGFTLNRPGRSLGEMIARIVGILLEGVKLLAGLRDVVLVVDPDRPAVGPLLDARGHAKSQEVI